MSLLLLFGGEVGKIGAAAGVLTLTAPPAALVASGNVILQADAGLLTLSAPAAALSQNPYATAGEITFSAPTATLVPGPVVLQATAGLLTLTSGTAGITFDATVPVILVNGVDRSIGYIRYSDLTMTDALDEQANTCAFTAVDFTPVAGQEIKIGLGAITNLIFAGIIVTVNQEYEGRRANVVYRCTAVDYTRLLDRRKVYKRYTAQSATAIIQDLIASFTSGFTSNNVVLGLPTIDEIEFTWEDVSHALTRIMKLVGGAWYPDYTRDIHAFITETVDAPDDITDAQLEVRDLTKSADLTQMRTRAIVEGGGSRASVEIAAGSTTIPVETSTWYAASGGFVKSGPQRITYTGKSLLDGVGSTIAGKTLSPGTPSAAVVSGTAGHLSVGAYQYKTAFVTTVGESELSAASSAATVTNVSAPSSGSASLSGQAGNLGVGTYIYGFTFLTAAGETTEGGVASVAISHVTAPAGGNGVPTTGGNLTPSTTYIYAATYITAVGETTGGGIGVVTLGASDTAVNLTLPWASSDGRVIGRRIYRVNLTTDPSGTNKRFVAEVRDNSTTTFKDTVADASLGGLMPSTNTSGSGKVSLTVPTSGDGRVTGRRVYRTEVDGATRRLMATLNDNSTTALSDNVADTSLGDPAPTTNTSGSGQMAVSAVSIGPAGTMARRIYRTEANGTGFKFLRTLNDNSTTSFTDNAADTSLGEAAPTESRVGANAGDSTLRVKDLAQFPASGWVSAGDQVIRFTGRSGSSGEGTLTGVPASGIGSIGAGIAYGASVVNHPHLTGISGVLYTIKQGDDVNVLVERNNTTAQANLAALEGGDGIHEHFIQDRRLSIASCEERGDAELTLFATAEQRLTFVSRDTKLRSGKTITVNLGAPTNISGTFKIQTVTISQFRVPQTYPLRTVTCSNYLYSIDHLFRQVTLGV